MSDVTEQPAGIAVIKAALPTILAADKNDILGKLAEKVRAFKPDISTPAGRDRMRSLAYEIARNKTELVKLGKSLTEDARAKVKAINAECSVIEERMDELRDRVRAPLTAWENAEKARVARQEEALRMIEGAANFPLGEPTSAEIESRLDGMLAYAGQQSWDLDFEARASDLVANMTDKLAGMLQAARRRESEAAELARLRAEQAERDRLAAIEAQRVREEQIAAQAAERAKVVAEEKAAREAREAAEAARIAQEATERREREARERAERLEREAEAAAEKAERDRLAAEQRAEREKAAAVEAERARLANIAAAEKAEADRRAANVAHQRKINGEALADLVAAGLTEEMAKAVVVAIAKGAVRHVRLEY